jgi:error-prone DNA polymerase
MEISMIAAGFSADDADALRRAMAAWKRKGGVDKFRGPAEGGMLANGYSEDFAEAHLRAGEGLRRLRLPREPCLQLRAAGLVEQLAQVPRAGVLPGGDAQLAAHGVLRPSQLIQDAQRHGIEVLPPDVSLSATGIARWRLPQMDCGSSPQ